MPEPGRQRPVRFSFRSSCYDCCADIRNLSVSCALYNKSIKIDEMINIGQSRGPVDAKGEAFKVVVRASNGKQPGAFEEFS